jgi:putative hemolysin
MRLNEQVLTKVRPQRYELALARGPEEIRQAQRLRYIVFADELGARLSDPECGLDVDLYDSWCEHLLVREMDTGLVVGTYRILPPDRAERLGGYYSEQEFDLTRLQYLRPRMVEVGRSCVHPEHRTGSVISLLWSGLAQYTMSHGHEYLIGCGSIGMHDGGHAAASIYHAAREKYLSPIEWRATPRCPLPLEALSQPVEAPMPPLIKGYFRLGAYVCGDPAWDPDFNTADLLLLLPLSRMNKAYARHFRVRP